MVINIMLIDAFPLWREGVKKAVSTDSEINIVLETVDVSVVKSAVRDGVVNFVLLDLENPKDDGFEILRLIRSANLGIPVLILSALPEESFGLRALREGATGYLTKDCTAEELVSAIRKSRSGLKYMSTSLTQKIANYLDIGMQKLPHERLTTREFQIMIMIGKGMTLKEVSEHLSLSYTTITTHKNRILTKMGLHSCAQIVWYVAEERLAK